MLGCFSNAFKAQVHSIEFERGDYSRNISQFNSKPEAGAESFKSNSSDFNILKKKTNSEFRMS